MSRPTPLKEAVECWTGADPLEPMEIDLLGRNPQSETMPVLAHVMFCWVNDRGGVSQSITTPTGTTGYALENLQLKEKFPRKAVDGWQVEVLRAVASGLYMIGGVR
jgi:hypothetical protein